MKAYTITIRDNKKGDEDVYETDAILALIDDGGESCDRINYIRTTKQRYANLLIAAHEYVEEKTKEFAIETLEALEPAFKEYVEEEQ